MNEYERQARACDFKNYDITEGEVIENRERLVSKYAWAIPNDAAIRAIAEHKKIIEIGAGTGYWAMLLAKAECDILAFDCDPPSKGPNEYRHNREWHPIKRGGPSIITEYPEYTLLLCWPPYESGMAFECLTYYSGDVLIYIGESNGGCNGDDNFWSAIESDWKEIRRIEIPQWKYIHDSLWFYERRQR
jgi:hypothetical protein